MFSAAKQNKTRREEVESYKGAKTMTEAEPVKGKICLVQAPGLNIGKLHDERFRMSDLVWRRIYNLFHWYADPKEGDFLIPETFSTLYGSVFEASFSPGMFGETRLHSVFPHFQEWISLSLDPAGYIRMTLNQEPAKVFRGNAFISPSYKRGSPEMKKHPLTFSLSDSQGDQEEEWRDTLRPRFPHTPTHSPVPAFPHNHPIVRNELRFQIYYLILRHFPTGMDTRELDKAYSEMFGKPPNIQSNYGISSDELLKHYMTDVLTYTQKSPVHAVVWARVDIGLEIPKKLLKKVGRWEEFRNLRERSSVPSESRPRMERSGREGMVQVQTEEGRRTQISSKGIGRVKAPRASVTAVSDHMDQGLASEGPGSRMSLKVQQNLRSILSRCLDGNPGGISFPQLDDMMRHFNSQLWRMYAEPVIGTPESTTRFLKSVMGEEIETIFSGQHHWVRNNNTGSVWSDDYYQELLSTFPVLEAEEGSEGAVMSSTGAVMSMSMEDSGVWEGGSGGFFRTSTPMEGNKQSPPTLEAGKETSITLDRERKEPPQLETGRGMRNEEMERVVRKGKRMIESAAISPHGASLPDILGHMEESEGGMDMERVRERLEAWVRESNTLSFSKLGNDLRVKEEIGNCKAG